MIKHTLLSLALAAIVPAVFAPAALASTFGQASNFNVFVFGNDTQSGSDVGGRTAIGGNYSGSTAFGTATNDGAGTYDLVVGGNLTLSNDAISAGDVFTGGATSLTSVNAAHNVSSNGTFMAQYSTVYGNLNYATSYSLNGATVNGATTHATTTPPIDFAGTKANLQTLTGLLNNQALTGTPLISYGSISLTAQSGLNIFDVNASNLASNYGLTITAAPGAVNPTVVINVVGGTNDVYSFASAGYQLNGLTANQVLYNFADATSITQSGSAVQGSILAPYANVNFSNGQVDGQIIVNSLSGNGEAHNYLFTGTLPQSTNANAASAVPEPATMITIGSILTIAAAWSWIARYHRSTSLPKHKPQTAELSENPGFYIE